MSANSLRNILDNIHNDKPINLIRLQTLIKGLDLDYRFELTNIKADKVKGNSYRVTHIEDELLAELTRFIDQAGTDRVSAAQQNLSHHHKVMGSYLMMIKPSFQDTAGNTSAYPIVVLFDEHGQASFPPNSIINSAQRLQATDVLLIENRQLFLQWQKTVGFLQAYCQFDSRSYDIVFAAGNEISNLLHKDFLASYQKLYFCFDIDLGGVTIAKNIISLLPNINYEFLMPSDIQDRVGQVVRRVSADDVARVRSLTADHQGLTQVCQVLSQNFKAIEQESFLYE